MKRLFDEVEIREALKTKVVMMDRVRIRPQSEFNGNWAVWYGAFLKTVVPELTDEETSCLAEGQFQVDKFLARCAKEGRKVEVE